MKLNYKQMEYKNLIIYYAKHRKTRHIKILIDYKKRIFVTSPMYVTNEELFNYIREKELWIANTIKKISNTRKIELNGKLNEEQQQVLFDKLVVFIEKYENLMNIKVKQFVIRNMKTLWGSCTFKKGYIRFNSKLYFMSDQFIEYIVVHEMSHLFIPNHSADFYKMVSKYLPNYKKISKEGKKVIIN